ncbi:outer membrane beta-barrel protein [Mucilaginibacter sp.]|uniref:outer membrane beta-barrel protein n=1 Tax=Mucilaginibacter sp. TaxID=1882438 RepID=UPI00284417A8|nr:outer membrane beta-barrel protein [Mucilaginibacter sp.]MDR3695402.1 outer membrane beta-barrel protein [Mucilaginibacter sp.]
MKYLFIIILLIEVSNAAIAQSAITLKGVITESETKKTLPKASLQLDQNGRRLLNTVSNDTGRFAFNGLRPGRYRVITSYLGFKSDTQSVVIKRDTQVFICLQSESKQLGEVKIKAPITPMRINGDTVNYNALAFPTKPYATVEDLLKILPGVEVDNDGNVTVNGQRVEKIMIGGRAFYIDDLRKGTQSLPADIIAHVQVFDSQSDIARLTGVKDLNHTKTINLELKEDKKNGFAGKVYAGAGNDGGYAAGGDINGISPSRLLFLGASANNINNQFNGTENNLRGGIVGKQQSADLNFNFRDDFNKKLTLQLTGMYTDYQTNQLNSSEQQNFLTDSSQLQQQINQTKSNQAMLNIGMNLTYKPDEHNYIVYNFYYLPTRSSQNSQNSSRVTTQKADTAYTASRGNNGNSSVYNGYSVNNSFLMVHQFSKTGESLTLSFNQSSGVNNQQTHIDNLIYTFNPAMTEVTDQKQFDPVRNENYNALILYSKPLGKTTSFNINYNWNDDANMSNQRAYGYNPQNGLYDIPDTLTTNNFLNKTSRQQLAVGLGGGSSKSGSVLNYTVSLAAVEASQQDDDLATGVSLNRTYMNWSPQATFVYQNKGRMLRITYSGQSNSPTIQQLKPLPDLSNPYLVNIGNPALGQSFNHDVNGEYLFVNAGNATNFQFDWNADLTQHAITASTTTLPGGIRQVTFVNINGVYHINAGASYGFPLLSPDNGTASIKANLLYGHDQSILNGDANTTQQTGINGEFKIDYHTGKWLFIESEASLNYAGNHYSLPNMAASKTLQQNYGLDINGTLPWTIMTGLKLSRQFDHTKGLPDQQNNLLSAFISKGIFKGGAGQLRLSGLNLLNTKAAINEAIGSNYILISRANIPQRLLLLSLVYNFSKFFKGKS